MPATLAPTPAEPAWTPPSPYGPDPALSAAAGGRALATVGPDPDRLRAVAADLRSVGVALRFARGEVAAATAQTLGCADWQGPAAQAYGSWAGGEALAWDDAAAGAARAAAALEELADVTAAVRSGVAALRAEGAACLADPARAGDVGARYQALLTRHEQALDLARQALVTARLLITGEQRSRDRSHQVVLDVTGGIGQAAWDAGPHAAVSLLVAGTPLGVTGALDPLRDAEQSARAGLVAHGGGRDGTVGRDIGYWTTTAALVVVPGTGPARVASRAAGLSRGVGGAQRVGPLAEPADLLLDAHATVIARISGGWSHEGGLRLTSGEDVSVRALHVAAAASERGITPRVLAVSQDTGVELVGLKHRLKGLDSLRRKVATERNEAGGRYGSGVDLVVPTINDAVRYTFQSSAQAYADDVERVTVALADDGFEPVAWSIRWQEGPTYKGLNTTWRSPIDGRLVEIQFHTPDSFYAKEVTHPLYGQRRVLRPGHPLIAQIQEVEREFFEEVPVPPGVSRLRSPLVPVLQ